MATLRRAIMKDQGIEKERKFYSEAERNHFADHMCKKTV